MGEKIVDEAHAKEALKEMIDDRKQGKPVEEVLAIFCQRYSVSMATCKGFYDELTAEGEIKEK
jgi:hypothetical protein